MSLRGRELKARLIALKHKHRVQLITRDPIPLAPATAVPQIVSGLAASTDLDSDRMLFAIGSLNWPDDLSRLPLLVRHSDTVAGKVLSLDYRSDGKLLVSARVDDPLARRMPAFSIAATVIESEVRDEGSPSGFHFVVTKATLDHVAVTDRPANPHALVTSRRDAAPWDDCSSHDDILAAVDRIRKVIDNLKLPVKSASEPVRHQCLTLGPAPPHIYGMPAAILHRRQTPFSKLVCEMTAKAG